MARVSDLKIVQQQDTDNTYFATWDFSHKSDGTTNHYAIRWFYDTGDGVWFTDQSISKLDPVNDPLNSSYSPPENAKAIMIHVTPGSNTYMVNGKETYYWTPEVAAAYYDLRTDTKPPIPSTPTVEIDGYTLTVSVDNYDPGLTEGPHYIEFYLYNHVIDPETGVLVRQNYKSAPALVTNGYASYKTTVNAGEGYSARCRARRLDTLRSDFTEYSDIYYTAPIAPSGFTRYRADTSTSVYFEWDPVTGADTYDIEYAIDVKYFDTPNNTTVVSGIEGTNTIVSGLETGDEYFFRIRAVNENGESKWSWNKGEAVIIGTGSTIGSDLRSSYPIVSIALGKAPDSPTTWSSATTVVVGEPLNLYWVHNAKDGSTETYAEIEITDDTGTETYTIENPNADDDENEDKDKTKHYTVDTTSYSEGVQIQWRVRTAGVTKTYGDWSVMRTVDIYAPPTLSVSITDKEGELIDSLTTFPFYIKGFSGPKTQMPIGYHVTIIANNGYETVDEIGEPIMVSAGQSVYSRYIDTNDPLLLEMTPANINLQNGITYTVIVIASMNSGLTVTEEVLFSVLWADEEYPLDAEIALDSDNYIAYITPYSRDGNGDPIPGLSLGVYRREFDGSFTEIASGLDSSNSTVVTDPHPSLDYARYRVIGIDNTTGAVSYVDIPGQPFGEIVPAIIQWDEKWSSFDASNTDIRVEPTWGGSMLQILYNIDTSENVAPEASLVKYIGRSYPVSYYGTQLESTASWSMEIPKTDVETLYQLRRLQKWTGDVYVREPSGSGYWANVGVSFSRKHNDLTIPITLDITRVEGGI